ncbi:MAG: GNAT family N-acetyltransferase [Candidatus Bathycorpusculaceae bacterium]
MGNECFCRVFREDDAETVRQLVESIFSGFLMGKYWDWKYKENPYFDSRLVAVAEANGEVVGCNHWLLRDLKFSNSLVDKAVLAADVAVKPEYRGKGLGSGLLQFLRESDVVKSRAAAVIYMFADPELAKKFHTPAAGYVLIPDGTAQYTKVLSWKKVKQNVDLLNEAIRSDKFGRKLPKRELKVLFEMSAAPPLCIRVKEDSLVVDDSEGLDDAHVVLSGEFGVFNMIKMAKRKKLSFLKALLTGKLKIKVRLTRLFSVFDALWIFEEVFSKKMT